MQQHQRHDRTLKFLFSHPKMVESLLRGFIKAAIKMLAMQMADETLIKKLFGFTKKEINVLRLKVSKNAAIAD